MISLILRLINITLIVVLALLIYKNRGKNSMIVIILFILSVIIFILNYIL
ncbi:hypothetical protein [Methanobrevibacter sp.]|nr:hypothetical protein [Methanobrevibacter sp.]MBQ2831175.1 hypothetical protein [Methanobrevibacter sp.]